MQNSNTIGLALRQFILGIGDKDEGHVFLEKVRSETKDESIHECCDELRDYMESDSSKFTEAEIVPCGTKRENGRTRKNKETSNETNGEE